MSQIQIIISNITLLLMIVDPWSAWDGSGCTITRLQVCILLLPG
jgi:hypothetical protein